ncbi:MAG: Hypoxanthine phosphoribosyltransferase [Syntrophus sp. SKADARSKE-3]|nr:Hypoxanthine phosphoribosyltransferase [Syntrophus sp. SKADARSKE-3]
MTMEKEVLFSREAIRHRIDALAKDIDVDYLGKDLIVIGVLKGAFIFMADLIRALQVPSEIDFVRLASYGAGSVSCGQIMISKDIEIDIRGRNVLIVEDIVDSGLTLSFLVDLLWKREPASIRACAFLDKRARRQVPFEADYVGFSIDDGFVVGYGLDYNEQARFLPDVYIVKNV